MWHLEIVEGVSGVQAYLAHKKQRPPRILQYDDAEGPMVVLGGAALSYARGTPVFVVIVRAYFR